MTMDDPNVNHTRLRNRNREDRSYAGWIIGGVIVAVVAVIALASNTGDNTNVASNDNATNAASTTGSGSATTGSGSSSDANSPRTPLPAGPRR